MVEQVVSSRFGKRPLLEVPALQMSRHGALEVPSLQAPAMASINNSPFPLAHNPMLGSGIYNPQSVFYVTGGLPPAPVAFSGFDRKHHSAPNGPCYNLHGQAYYYGPNGETVFPAPIYNPQNLYPGVVNPFPSYAPVQPPVILRIPYPSFGLTSPGFNIKCELEYGRVMSIDVRDSDGEFKGMPEFLRTELIRTYGAYPYTEVKIKLEGGEFHIYATHENRRKHRRRRQRESDSDSDSEIYYDKYAPYPDWNSDVDSYSNGVRPKNPGERPRGIVRERGWNRFR